VDTAFGGDDRPVAFADRPAVRAAFAEPEPAALIESFARIGREVLERSAAIQHVLATAAAVDAEARALLAEIRDQRHTGQSRIVAALDRRDALDPAVDRSEVEDAVHALMSPELYRILTVERGWSGDRYEAWLARLLTIITLALNGNDVAQKR
jgi:TetR/AcrR family transcriptional regulator, regulator of autoinduction and epiphytic fitness